MKILNFKKFNESNKMILSKIIDLNKASIIGLDLTTKTPNKIIEITHAL